MANDRIKSLKDFVSQCTTSAGVYLMKDVNNKVIYIGKAKKLKNRLQSYFSGIHSKPIKTQRLVAEIFFIETILVNNDPQALLLERALIKSHRPRYNILLRDDKNYPYIKVNMNDDYPRVNLVRKRLKDGAYYLGPFSCSKSLYKVMQLVHNLYPLVRCSAYEFSQRKRPCNYHGMKLCLAPCYYKISSTDYKKVVKQALDFIESDQSDMHKIIETKMFEASRKQDFQRAIVYRDQLLALGNIRSQHNATYHKITCGDFINWTMDYSIICFNVTHIENHLISGSENFIIQDVFIEDVSIICSQFILQYYENRYLPELIVLPIKLDNIYDLEKALMTGSYYSDSDNNNKSNNNKLSITLADNSKSNTKTNSNSYYYEDDRYHNRLSKAKSVKIRTASNKDKDNVLETALNNAKFFLQNHLKEYYTDKQYIQSVKSELQVEVDLDNVECIDISHFAGTAIVASKVLFKTGKPNKSQYRKYNISNVDNKYFAKIKKSNPEFLKTQNDYAAISHVLYRRLKRLSDDKMSKKNWPNLIVIDGGKGQLNCAKKIKDFYFSDLDIKIFSIAKPNKKQSYNKKHHANNIVDRERIFYHKDKPPIVLEPNTISYRFFTQLRNEAHRFAVSHHQSVFKKARHSSVLEQIPGVGPKTRIKLLRTFGSLQNIRCASKKQLLSVSGVDELLAKKIKDYMQE